MFPEQSSPASPEVQRAARAGAVRKLILIVAPWVAVVGLFALINSLLSGRPNVGARIIAAQTQISAFEAAIEMFHADTGRYPTSLQGLIQAPTGTTNWLGPYLKAAEIPQDFWGNNYVYQYPGAHTNLDVAFDLYSTGPDGKSIIPNWELPAHRQKKTP